MSTIATDGAGTAWPSSTTISTGKKAFLMDYFRLFDTDDSQAGEKIAELFTEDGCIISPAGTLQGPESELELAENAQPRVSQPNPFNADAPSIYHRDSNVSRASVGCDQNTNT